MSNRFPSRAEIVDRDPVEEEKLGRRERNKRDKRERILNAAKTLFRAQGFETTTTQQIAEQADVGFGTLYLYCESKEDLLVLVFHDEMQQVIEEAYASVPTRAALPAQLEHMFERFVAYHARDLPLARALIRELSVVPNPGRRVAVRSLGRKVFATIAELVGRAQRRGEVDPDVEPREAARTIFAVYYQLLQSFLSEFVTEPRFREQLRSTLQLLMRGLGPGGRQRARDRGAARSSARPRRA